MGKESEGLKPIARIRTDLPEKFGIPRQSGLVKELQGRIIFEPDYRSADAVKGLEGYDYIWLLWHFDGTDRENWSATVKPPRLGGNTHMGVFATRSPFRPNPIGLSCVRLERVEMTKDGPVLFVSGADLRDQTVIYDIKPYLVYADCHPDARSGFAEAGMYNELEADIPPEMLSQIPMEKRAGLIGILKQDPRPAYHDDPERIYGLCYAGYNVRFRVADRKVRVCEVSRQASEKNDFRDRESVV